ncbi:DUF2934 domain-containing protein [Salinarimonas sp.]|uniref:DUF2934 domain-containing protein n=1 Tax=Salinarimonas sp. TaxID=2766526 RepID=UPI0032D982D8
MHELEDKIRVRAYELWERDGRAGDAEGHWYAAEGEIHAELTRALDVEVAPAAPAKKPARRAKPAAEKPAAEKPGGADAAPRRKSKARTSAT